jgi:hypothetical protein
MYHLFHPYPPEAVVHSDDLALVRAMVARWNRYTSLNRVFQIIRAEDDDLWLYAEGVVFRARRERFEPVPRPVYAWGDTVRLKAKPARLRRVLRLHYHRVRGVVVYAVESSDPIGRAYWFVEELEPDANG